MEMKASLNPIYVQEFQFKQANTSQISDGFTSIPDACNLLTADRKRGLLYVGHNDKISVLKPIEESSAEWKIELQLPSIVSKIAINCDYSCIAVAIAQKPTVLIYDTHSLVRNSFNLLLEITTSSNPTSYVTDIRWNPAIPLMLCTIASDCTNGSFQLKIEDDKRENSISKVSVLSKVSNELQVLCAAWSPKGKQVVVGCKNGDIIQLKPDLKVARIITGPSPPMGEVISILWISNYQFCAAYLNNEQHINVFIIDAPKGESKAIFTCYEDITYGFRDPESDEGVPRYYFEYVSEWGLIIAGSSNSSEIAVLGSTDGGANWNQWQLVDSGRAQLPLMRTTEIFPMGLAVDKSPTNKLPWGTDSTLPHPVPVLHIFGTSGRLCSFHMVNLAPDFPAINLPPTEIITSPVSLQSSNLPAEISFNMNAAVTSTPRPKQQEIIPERVKPTPTSNIFGDSLKTVGFFQQPEQPTEQPKLQEQKPVSPIITSTVPISQPMTPKETPLPLGHTKTETKSIVNKEIKSPQAAKQKVSIDDSTLMRAYLQEQALFEKELRNKLVPQVWECGTDEEKKQLGETSARIEQFLKELKDTTNSLSNDIAYLKALLLQSFAWVEETKSKNEAGTDITSRNCGENSKIAELQRLYYYTQTQLSQVSKILDLEWSMHTAQEQKKMKIPSLEFIYQNLLLHSKIIAKEKEKFEQISRKWKFLNRSIVHTNSTSSILNLSRTMADLHVSSPKSSTSTVRGKTDVIINARCKAIALKTLSFTHEKQIKLKMLLTESSPRIIKSVNPSIIQDRLKATLSALTSGNPEVNPEAETKTETLIVQQCILDEQSVEKSKPQSPLASLNSIVARIGSSDMKNLLQNKAQPTPLSTNLPFPTTFSAKQTEKQSTVPAASCVMSQAKQDLNVSLSSITFGTSVPKSQEIFPKSSLAISSSKESMNDSVNKSPESALFSTGLLKSVLSTEHTSTKTEGTPSNLSLLPATSIVKTDAAATFSFATPNMASIAKTSPSTPALNMMMSFAYGKPSHNPPIEPFIGGTTQIPLQASTELMALSLGSSNQLTLQSPSSQSNNNTNSALNRSPVAAQIPPMTAALSAISNMSEVPINLVNTNVSRKPSQTEISSSSVTIENIATKPEVKAPVLSNLNTQTSILSAPVFNSQSIAKSTVAVSETPTTLPVTTFVPSPFPSITPTFGTRNSTLVASVFNEYSNVSTNSSTTTTSSATISSPFQSSLSKPIFGETATSISNTSFGINNTPTSTITFGVATTAASITPAFGKSPISSPISSAQFSSVQTPASATNVFEKPINSPTSSPFGNASDSVFSNVPATSSNTSIFGGNTTNSIFGTPTLSSSSNIFGGNSTIFGTAPSGSIFEPDVPKSGSLFGGATNTASASPFGSSTSNASLTAVGSSPGVNVFQSTMTNTSPMGISGQQPAFGQAPTFGAKSVFGASPSIFGASKPVFGSGFGSPPTFESSPSLGFGNPPPMQSNPAMENVMPKVFGEVTGSSTFESLASQSGGLSFGSLAQKSPEPEKSTFTASSSFSSWR